MKVDISKHRKWLDELETIIRASSTPEELILQDKKERGRLRYKARYQRIGAKLAKQRKSRWSDAAVPRYGDGIPPRHELRVTNRAQNRIILKGLLPGLFKRDEE